MLIGDGKSELSSRPVHANIGYAPSAWVLLREADDAQKANKELFSGSSNSMTANQFRRLALSLPEVVESAHMGHPDFRAGGKIFATLGAPDERWGMLKLTLEQQRHYVEAEPKIFVPVKGGWGRRGATNVKLAAATRRTLWDAMTTAWRNVSPN